ncbi:uncharacterized protein LOC118411565 isoform X2 [Branchiostoma floridae]|uniref:Uncharacterized protein LOC118411565 isoform X2 n=1 Tax=Branchiostoma floridae TaxID=7739 RepID=C3YDX2_BRAFL|nr:uncharacterized protein LOC118411565 isoform X2 [Branchiostoma floridae]|eukprot:XP_002605581.1 hypothetical protein BRAFLDRAFT_127294 [Branchiostoma floridae]
MSQWPLSLVLTAFLSQQFAGCAATHRPTRSAPCLIDADCLVFQECVWDRSDYAASPTGICLGKKHLIRRAALKQEPANSPSVTKTIATPAVKAKTASKRFKHDTSAYMPSAFGGSNEPTRFDNQNYGRITGGRSENVFNPNQSRRPTTSQQYQGSSALSGGDKNGGLQQGTGWRYGSGPERGVQNTGPQQVRPGIIIKPSLGQGQWQPAFLRDNLGNVAAQSSPQAHLGTYGVGSNVQNERKPGGYISGPITGAQQTSQILPKEKSSTEYNHDITPSGGQTEESTSNDGDDWRSHVSTFSEDSSDEKIVLDNSKDVNFVETVPKHTEPHRGDSYNQGANGGNNAGGLSHGISQQNREKAGTDYQTRRHDVQRAQLQKFNSHGSFQPPRKAATLIHKVPVKPRTSLVKQDPRERLSSEVFDPILGEPTGVEQDGDEVDVVSKTEQTKQTNKDYF